ncbi:MAG: glycosyltransferase family 39 protein [bacterium]|nr:glycosyltransferase family 39 protein [bacterium]
MRWLIDKYASWIIVLAAAVLYLPFLGSVRLFDWDEINFAECAREMLLTKNYLSLQMNFLPFSEKPPLFIWLSALSMHFFGVNEFAARLPNAVCGMLTLVILFKIGSRVYSPRMGWLWVLSYAGSTLPMFYFKSGIIDPWFNLFIFLGIYFFVLFSYSNSSEAKNRSIKHVFLSALFIGLAILTKGPVALLIYGGCVAVFLVFKKFKKVLSLKQFFILAGVIAFVGGLWFLLLVIDGKLTLITHFVSYQIHLQQTEDSGHGGPFYYHFIVLLLGCFPASVFALRAFKFLGTENGLQKQFRELMLVLFWVVFLLFSFVVKTKIVHYSSLCYFPLTFLAALGIQQLISGELAWKKWMSFFLIFVGLIFGLALSALPLVEPFKQQLIASGWIKDAFAIENLKASVHWSGFDYFIGLLTISSVIYSGIELRKKNYLKAVLIVFLANMLVVELASLVLAPKIEQYSQAAAIDFYESKQNESCYISALGYHSYAQYFYPRRAVDSNPQHLSTDWMLAGPIDKRAYFVAKIDNVEEHLIQHPSLKEIGRKNGYVFLLRERVTTPH